MHDLTKGSPFRSIVYFAIPLMVGGFFQLAYNIFDAMIVGQTLGQKAFAAVGATGSITFLILGFSQGLTAGFSILTAQRIGAQDAAGVKRSYVHGLLLTLLVSIVLSIATLLWLKPLLFFMKTPAELVQASHEFLLAIFGGAVFTVLFNFYSNSLRALGDSTTPLYALLVACILNILLDFVMILVLGWGVFGAGLATVIAQGFSALVLQVYIHRRVPQFRVKKEEWRLEWQDTMAHLKLGLPMAFQNSIIAIGSITLQVVLNQLGTAAIVSNTIGGKIDQIAMLPMGALGQGVSTFTAQNYGAKLLHRIAGGVRKTLYLIWLWSLFYGISVIVFNRFFSTLFVPHPTPDVLRLAEIYDLTNASLYILLGTLFILRSFLQGLGKALAPTLAGVMELVMRVLVSILGLQTVGYIGVAFSNPAAWLGSLLILLPATRLAWKRMSR